MIALPIIEREWPSVAADLRDGLDVDTVRDRAAETFDSEEYGRLCALLEVHEAEAVPRSGDLTDREALDMIAAKLNEPGQWNGGDVCEVAAMACRLSGRTIATD